MVDLDMNSSEGEGNPLSETLQNLKAGTSHSEAGVAGETQHCLGLVEEG
jgi:hypothetical protein